MVDVSQKQRTVRKALAQCQITMNQGAYSQLRERKLRKGDGVSIAEIAGLMASKQTSQLIPLCHQISLDFSKVSVHFDDDASGVVTVLCETQVTDKTGCEMEAMTGATVAALTIYDMCKSLDKEMVVGNARLLRKTGGKSGDYSLSDQNRVKV